MLRQRISDGGILSEILDWNVLAGVLDGEDKTWFGQLMSTPQLIAWLIQFDYWLKAYNIDLTI